MGSKNHIRIKLVLKLFLLIGLVGWLIPFFNILTRHESFEFPNSLRQGLCVDNSGNIFCGSQAYNRIQMYDKNGDFIRAFSTDIGKGSGYHFTFEVKDNQLDIHVYGAWLKSERFDRKITYSLNGEMIRVTDIPSTEYVGYNVVNEATDSFGNHYIFKGFLFPRIEKIVSGSSNVIINTPFYLWFFQTPFPAFAFFSISFIALLGMDPKLKLFRKKADRDRI